MEVSGGNSGYSSNMHALTPYFLNSGNDVLVFRLNDNVEKYDAFYTEMSRDEIIKAMKRYGKAKRYVFDLNNATFIDSSAIGALLDVEIDMANEGNGAIVDYVVHNSDAEEILNLMDRTPCWNAGSNKNRIPGIEGDYTKL